ncbi:MAG: S1 RNA-binding domain-containing protein, partial [Bacilli bacterium]
VTGKVKRLVNFGAFVEIAPGIEGLVHISQISHQHISTPHEVLSEGQEVKVKILDINPTEQRVSLSIRDTEEKPDHNYRNVNTEDFQDKGMGLTIGDVIGDQLRKLK